MHTKNSDLNYIFAFFDQDKELDEKFRYSALAVMKLEDDKMTLCFAANPAMVNADPEKLEAPKDSGLILLELEKQK